MQNRVGNPNLFCLWKCKQYQIYIYININIYYLNFKLSQIGAFCSKCNVDTLGSLGILKIANHATASWRMITFTCHGNAIIESHRGRHRFGEWARKCPKNFINLDWLSNWNCQNSQIQCSIWQYVRHCITRQFYCHGSHCTKNAQGNFQHFSCALPFSQRLRMQAPASRNNNESIWMPILPSSRKNSSWWIESYTEQTTWGVMRVSWDVFPWCCQSLSATPQGQWSQLPSL